MDPMALCFFRDIPGKHAQVLSFVPSPEKRIEMVDAWW